MDLRNDRLADNVNYRVASLLKEICSFLYKQIATYDCKYHSSTTYFSLGCTNIDYIAKAPLHITQKGTFYSGNEGTLGCFLH